MYAFFRTPMGWARLYGLFGEVRALEDGWRAVPLQGLPWPLVARITEDRPLELVRWRGWRPLTALAERLFLEQRFRGIWAMGFRRLHRRAQGGHSV